MVGVMGWGGGWVQGPPTHHCLNGFELCMDVTVQYFMQLQQNFGQYSTTNIKIKKNS
jgi:hypothetical protein